eukprot:c20727_g2_i1 orf=2-235(-)
MRLEVYPDLQTIQGQLQKEAIADSCALDVKQSSPWVDRGQIVAETTMTQLVILLRELSNTQRSVLMCYAFDWHKPIQR